MRALLIVVVSLAALLGVLLSYGVGQLQVGRDRVAQVERERDEMRDDVDALERRLVNIQSMATRLANEQRAFQYKWWNDRCDTSGLPAEPELVATAERPLPARSKAKTYVELVGPPRRRAVGGR